MKTTWKDIIESDVAYIDLIGYGSILNRDSHEGDTSEPDCVIVKGFQRIYNLKMVPDALDIEILEAFRKKYWVKYNINSIWEVLELREQNVCVLNAMYTGKSQDKVNGVLIRIPRKDFETYWKREEIYDLYKTHYSFIDPLSWEISTCENWGYILSAQSEYLIEDGHAFLPYHEFSRAWAYHFGEYFGKLFDETTLRVQKK